MKQARAPKRFYGMRTTPNPDGRLYSIVVIVKPQVDCNQYYRMRRSRGNPIACSAMQTEKGRTYPVRLGFRGVPSYFYPAAYPTSQAQSPSVKSSLIDRTYCAPAGPTLKED